MSQHGRKKGRKHRKPRGSVLTMECFKCLQKDELSASKLLARLTEALNLLEEAGMPPKVQKGFISAEGERGGGFVLPPLAGSGWEMHMVIYSPTAHYLSCREDEIDS